MCGVRSRAPSRPPVSSAATTPIADKPTATHSAAVKPDTNVLADAYTPGRANTVARTATPTTPPSWRIVLLVPEATPATCGGTEPITALVTVGKQNDVPVPAIS